MPLTAVKMCCYFKNSDFLQKIIDQYSAFDLETLKKGLTEEEIAKFEIKQIFNYDYLEGKRKLEYHNYRTILETFAGNSPLHIAIMRNSYPCVRLLCEETSIPIIDEKED